MTLLSELEVILESHPEIDELGFIHPSQFATLEKEIVDSSHTSSCNDEFFWCNDNKLGISTSIVIPLYNSAKEAFFYSLNRYRMLSDAPICEGRSSDVDGILILESEVMRHSKALILLSCDFGTAWNSRKLIVSKKVTPQALMDELMLSALVLSYSPKSERAWNHRKWVIKKINGKNDPNLFNIVDRECSLVKTITEKSKMNYRAWTHLCWLVPYMSHEQIMLELNNFRDWAGIHVADNSCFHYRTRLLLKMMEKQKDVDPFSDAGFHKIWEEELDWVGSLIRHYVGREALWMHRRFLSLLWMKHLLANNDTSQSHRLCCADSRICNIDVFIKEELNLISSCNVIPDTQFEDYQEQAMHSATYSMWLAKPIPVPFGIELQKIPVYEKLKTLLENNGKSYISELLTNCGSMR